MSYYDPTSSQGVPAEQETQESPQSEQPQAAPQAAPQTPSKSTDKTDAVKAAQSDALTPDQKHKNYLDDIERLHNEP